MIWIIEKIKQFGIPAAVFLAAMTIFLSFAINEVSGKSGPQVAQRFLERGTKYDTEYLKTWVSSNPGPARHYAWPVLFPLDFFFMFALGGFLAVGSAACALEVDILTRFAGLFVIVPALYVAADLFEDVLLACLLLNASSINENSVRIAQATTSAKIKLASLSIVQAIVLSLWAFFQAQR